MSHLIQFTHKQLGKIRVLEKNGESWFIANDICKILGYANPRKAVADHVDNEDKNTVTISYGKKGNPNQIIINESGLYSLIIRSNKPEAKKFKRWVTSEVLPSIRKTGMYVVSKDPKAVVESWLKKEYEKGFKEGLQKALEKVKYEKYNRLMLRMKRSKLNINEEWLKKLKRYLEKGYLIKDIAKLLDCSTDTVARYRDLMKEAGMLGKNVKLPVLESNRKRIFN